MNYKTLGNTGLSVSTICLGTMNFGGRGYFKVMGNLDQQAANQQLQFAVEAGVNFIDTANVYSDGLAEEMIGEAIRHSSINRHDLVIATKVRSKVGEGPNDRGLSRKHIMNQVELSLRRLKTDYVDLYQIHSTDPATPIEETIRTLDDLVRSGKVRYIGASNMMAWHLMKALDYSKYCQKERFVSLQAQYSVASRELEREIVPLLQDQQLGLMVWSPLYGGLLTGKYTAEEIRTAQGRLKAFYIQPHVVERALSLLAALQTMAQQKDTTIAKLSLAWLLQQPAVTSLVVGASTLRQLEDNLQSVEVTFAPEELQQLEELSQLPLEYPGSVVRAMEADRMS